MPFGAIFAAFVFAILCVGWGHRFTMAGVVPASVAWPLWSALGLTLAAGLLLRRGWARWVGLAASLLLAAVGSRQLAAAGGTLDQVVLLSALASAALLAIPATGAFGRPEGEGTAEAPRRGRIHGWICAGLTAGLTILFLFLPGWTGPGAPPGPPPVPERASPSGSAPRLAASAADARSSAPSPPGSIPWGSFGSALRRARAEGKPMFVEFYATWCGVCRRMERMTYRDAAVARRLAELLPVRVDSEDETSRDGFRGTDLAERHGVAGYPTLLLLDRDGRELSRRAGYLDPRALLAWIDSTLSAPSGARVSNAAGR